MDFLSAAMLGLVCQYNSSNSFASIRPQSRTNQLNGRLQEICGRLPQTDGGTADRKELVRELQDVSSQLQQTQYQDQMRKFQERQLELLAEAEKKKWEQYRRENKAGALAAASMSKLVSADGKYGTYSRSGTFAAGNDGRDWRQSESRAADDVDRDIQDSRTLGIMAADAARRRKRQKTRAAVQEEQENKIKDRQHADSAAYLLLELQRRKRKKVIDAYI
jgi:hypothetical protein